MSGGYKIPSSVYFGRNTHRTRKDIPVIDRHKAIERKKIGFRFVSFIAIIIAVIMIIQMIAIIPTPSSTTPVKITYTSRAPIVILGDADFTAANGVTGGNGVPGDEYIIEGWDIDASGGHAITISNTLAYFIIRNCYLHDGRLAPGDGIIMTNVENGKILTNTIINNNHGIHFEACDFNYIIRNNISFNGLDGIYLDQSDNNSIENNTCFTNSWNGVFLSLSNNNTVDNNTCRKNEWDGIYLEASSWNYIDWNNVSENIDDGIAMFWNCLFNTVYQNVVISNGDYGAAISAVCIGNMIWENTFMYNRGSLAWPAFNPLAVQGYDDNGGVNMWSMGGMGNYWHDWTAPDNPPDGIVDIPYLLDGGTGDSDFFPLTNWVVIPEPAVTTLVSIMVIMGILFMIQNRKRKK